MIDVKKYLIEEMKMSEGMANIVFGNFSKHADIFAEVQNYVSTGDTKGSKLKIATYTVDKLIKDKGMKPLEAFTYMVYLKEFPTVAKKELKK